MEKRVLEAEHDIKEIHKVLYQVVENIKNSTRNIDLVTADVKMIAKVTGSCDVVYARLESLEKFAEETRKARAKFGWILVALLTSAIGAFILKGGLIT